jgi:hypothetical protein
VVNAFLDDVFEVAHVISVTASGKSKARDDCQSDGVNGLVNVRFRQRFGLLFAAQRRRCLTLCETIDTIVVDNVGHVKVAASRVDEVACAYA